tara:strand:- start:1470 stop:2381 length:912 start_codon:yes stop_codon:yes gene_type:complete
MPDRYQSLMDQIRAGVPILIDGATGTEVERRGVKKIENAWNSAGILSDPDVVQDIHEDYIRCGSQIVISNTFATHRSTLEDAGIADQFETYNRRSVEIAIAAREKLGAEHVLVAGGLSHWSFSGRKPSIEAMRVNAVEQAQILATAGAELLLLEMMSEIDRMLAVLDGAQSTGLPVWPGLSCKLDEQGVPVLLDGEPLVDAMQAITDKDIDLISIMHTDVEHVAACLDVVDACWSGPVGVYAHSGDFAEDASIYFETVISEQGYCDHAKQWLARGVKVVGGCCGVGPAHIDELATLADFGGSS